MISIISINVNGLKHRINQLYQLIYDHKSGITCIQEVHEFSNEQVGDLEKKSKATIYLNSHKGWVGWNHLTRKITRKITKFNQKHLTINQIRLQNRLTHIQINAKRIIDIICIYAPAMKKEKIFMIN